MKPRERLADAVRVAAKSGEPALVAFLTAGYPSAARFREHLLAVAAGSDVIEIGVPFTDPMAAVNVGTPLGIPLHPTQLYDAGAELLILGVLLATERKGKPFGLRCRYCIVLIFLVLHTRNIQSQRAWSAQDGS